MKIEFTVPLPDIETQPKVNLDGFLDEALSFMTERPVFTAQELHEYLLSRFSIGDDPREFWRCLTSIRIAVQEVCEMNGTPAEWHQQEKNGYASRLFNLDVAGPPLGELFESELAQHVRAELSALFHGREEIKQDELLFYLRAHQGFTDEAEEILQSLIDDGFIAKAGARTYALPQRYSQEPLESFSPAPAGTARPERELVEVDGVMVLLRQSPPKAFAPQKVEPPVRQRPPEVSPPTPDQPFTARDASRALIVLRRLAWHDARYDGVRVSTLVRFMEDGRMAPREGSFIVARLWRRGYLLRDVSDPQDSVVRLRPDIPEDAKGWQAALDRILHELSLPYDPSAQQKTGSE